MVFSASPGRYDGFTFINKNNIIHSWDLCGGQANTEMSLKKWRWHQKYSSMLVSHHHFDNEAMMKPADKGYASSSLWKSDTTGLPTALNQSAQGVQKHNASICSQTHKNWRTILKTYKSQKIGWQFSASHFPMQIYICNHFSKCK